MPKQSIPFTETYLKSLPIPESGDDSYNDRGLRLRVYPSAAKKWSFFKQAPNGIRKSIPIGDYPNINLKQAREIADKLLGDMLREGHDIATNKKGVTFGEHMSSDAYKNWSRSTRNSHTTIMNNLTDVVPVWFHRKPLKLFSNDDFTKFCNDRKDGKDGRDGVIESTINHTLNNIHSVFRHAFDNSVIKENPMDRLKKYILKINLTQKIIVIIFIFHITTGYALLKETPFCGGQNMDGYCTGDDIDTVFFGILITLLFSFFLIGNK